MDIKSISAQDVGSKIDGQKSQATASDSATATLNQQLSQLLDTAKDQFTSLDNGGDFTRQNAQTRISQFLDSFHIPTKLG
ncbi:hypothetical protein [Simkania sp.]|uniref:hypothetical protein n=1 Tax=Simkania sp. TaxID=34094 RepID=UPI003B515C14